MKTESILAGVYLAFSEFQRPEHCLPLDLYEPERHEFEESLACKTRENLRATDLGQLSWSPESLLTPEAVAYFMPRLIELAISGEFDANHEPYMFWFINSMSSGPSEPRYALFGSEQVKQVRLALEFLAENYRDQIKEACWHEALEDALRSWGT